MRAGRTAAALACLLAVATALAFGIYMFLFGIGFAINYTYFPELRHLIDRLRPIVMGVTWVATFSTLSLIYVLVCNHLTSKRTDTSSQKDDHGKND